MLYLNFFYNIKNEKIISILIYMLPIELISSSFLSDLLVSLSGLLFIYFVIKKKEWEYFRNKLFFFFFCGMRTSY